MTTMYCIAHKDDAEWLIGEIYDSSNWHAVKHQFYDFDVARDAVNNGPKQYVLIKCPEDNGVRRYSQIIDTKIPA